MLLGASLCCEPPSPPPEEAKFNGACLQNHSQLAQTAWQALYTHIVLHFYQKSVNLEILG